MATRSPLVVNESTGNPKPIDSTDKLGPFAAGTATGEAMIYDQFDTNASKMQPTGTPSFGAVTVSSYVDVPLIQNSTHIDITPASGHVLDLNIAGAGGFLRVLSNDSDGVVFERASDADPGAIINYYTGLSAKWSLGPVVGGENFRLYSIGASGNAILVDYTTGYSTLMGLTVSGNLTVNGNTTIGNASGDTLTVAPNAVTWTNDPTHSGNHTFSGDVSVNGNTTLGSASGDTLTISPNAITWANNPTHSGNHTFSGNVSVNGATTIGDASGDSLTVNAAAWSIPNTVTWTKAAESGVAEEFFRVLVSDSTSYMRLVNGTSNVSQFAPTFEAFIEAGVASTALTFSGTKGVSTTPGNPAILYIARYNSGSGNTDIPDAGIMVEWRNRATPLIYVYGNGDLVLTRSGAKLGYGTGTGGTATQATSKSTGVTLNKSSGQITLNNAALNGDTTVSFTLTNSVIAATDILALNHVSGGTAGSYLLNAQAGAGSASINVRNITTGSLSEAIVIGFVVIKGATA